MSGHHEYGSGMSRAHLGEGQTFGPSVKMLKQILGNLQGLELLIIDGRQGISNWLLLLILLLFLVVLAIEPGASHTPLLHSTTEGPSSPNATFEIWGM